MSKPWAGALLLILLAFEAGAAANRFYMSAVAEAPIAGANAGGIDASYLLLLPGGVAYRGIPENGTLLSAGVAELRRRNPDRLGLYRQSGSRLSIHWAVGEPWVLAAAGDAWRRGKRRYFPVRPIGRKTLSGVFVTAMDGVRVGAPAGSIDRTRRMVFFANGRFLRSPKALTGGGDSNASDSQLGGQQAGSGSYSIDGFTLTLRHDGGGVTRHSIFYWPDWDRALGIDYGMYQYQGPAPTPSAAPRRSNAPNPAATIPLGRYANSTVGRTIP